MFVTVVLIYSKKKLVIPIKWVYSLDILQLLNGCNIRDRVYTIYYSTDLTSEPNFHLPISIHFDEVKPAIYKAQVGRFFGKSN